MVGTDDSSWLVGGGGDCGNNGDTGGSVCNDNCVIL